MSHRLALSALAALALLLMPACAPRKAPPAPDIVLVTVDRLRWEELAPWGGSVQAPALAQLQASSARFVNVVSCAPGGAPAAMCVLTGVPPETHGIRVLDDGRLAPSAQSLADRLGSRGWATAAFLQTDQVTTTMQADRGFQVWDGPVPGFPTGHPGASQARAAEETVAAAMHWLLELPKETAGLAWVHLAEPAPPELSGAERATRTGELDRVLGALLSTAKGRGDERKAPPIIIICNLSSHGAEPALAPEEAFLLQEASLRVRILVTARGVPAGDVTGLAGLDEVAGLAEALASGSASRLLDLARGRGEAREAVLAETLVPHASFGAEPVKVALRAAPGVAGAADPAVAAALASDASWPGGHGDVRAPETLGVFRAVDAAWALQRQGRAADALAAFSAALPPGDAKAAPDARAGLGLALALNGRPAEALVHFEALASQEAPGSLAWAQGNLGLAMASGGAGEAARARAALDAMLARTPGDLRALTWLARTAERSGDRGGAVQAILKIVEQDPDNPFALAELGRLYLAAGRPREAADSLMRALARQPSHPGLLLAAADALASSGDWWSAMDRISERERLYGESPETNLAKARCWRDTQRWELAEQSFAKVVAVRPSDARARLGLAEAQMFIGGEKEAAGRAELKRARELAPGDPAACAVLKGWAMATGRDPAAEARAEGCPE